MTGKNITKRKKVFAFVCIVIFFGEAILFVLNAATDYKTYTDSKVVKAEVINVSGTKKKEIRIRKNAPEQIVTASIKSAILQNVAFALCLFAYVLASINLIEQIG